MSRGKRSAAGTAVGMVLFLSLTAASARAQQQPAPFAPDWAMFAGGKVFAEKGCGKCHAIQGFGGKVGPDLGRIEKGKSFFELAAAIT